MNMTKRQKSKKEMRVLAAIEHASSIKKKNYQKVDPANMLDSSGRHANDGCSSNAAVAASVASSGAHGEVAATLEGPATPKYLDIPSRPEKWVTKKKKGKSSGPSMASNTPNSRPRPSARGGHSAAGGG